MQKKSIVGCALVIVFLCAAAEIWAQSGGGNAPQISGTIYGKYDPAFEGNGAWVGYAVISFNGGSARKASFADRNSSFAQNKDGSIMGTETITLTFLDGSGILYIDGRFNGVAKGSPSLYVLYESGTVSRGTGKYSRAKGEVVVEGPFLMPNPDMVPGNALWISEIYGSISGVD